MDKQTTFQINITQRRRRLANIRVTVAPETTNIDAVAFGNESAVPLALGILLYSAHSFAPDGDIRAAIELALAAYDPSAEIKSGLSFVATARQKPPDGGDLPF